MGTIGADIDFTLHPDFMKVRAREHQCTIRSSRLLTPTVFELAFDTQEPLDFVAGQFISVIIPGAGPNGRDLRRAYSIASNPETLPIALCIKIVADGPGTQYLYRLKEGSSFRALAPYGDFVYQANPQRYACFVATGTGIAPFASIITSEQYQQTPPLSGQCFLGVRTVDELLYVDTLNAIFGHRFVPAVSQAPAEDPWSGYRGRVTDYLKTHGISTAWDQTDFYLCGHGGMIQEVKNYLFAQGVQKSAVFQEVYYK